MGWLDALRDFGGALSEVTERWVPDAWVICMLLTAIALALTLFGAGAGLEETVLAWGAGVWNLLELAMQFTIALVAAHACVASRPVHRTLDLLAGLPDPQKPVQAVALAGSVSLVTGYLNWAFCIVACALFVPFLCKRNPRADVRVLVAASYIGLGTVWHGGFSGSGPLILATPGNPLLEPGSGLAVVDRLYCHPASIVPAAYSSVPKTGQNRRTSRPHLALRGTTWHKSAPYMYAYMRVRRTSGIATSCHPAQLAREDRARPPGRRATVAARGR